MKSNLAASFLVFFVTILSVPANAEVVGGPVRGEGVVKPGGDAAKYLLRFYAFKDAKVRVTGDGRSNLVCYLTDDNGNVLAQTNGLRSSCYFSFNPIRTGTCQLSIKNQGKLVSHFRMEAD